MAHRIAVIPGDGVGAEISEEAVRIAEAAGFVAGVDGFTVRLSFRTGVVGLVWYVAPRDKSTHIYTGPTILINAHSGEVERETAGFNQ